MAAGIHPMFLFAFTGFKLLLRLPYHIYIYYLSDSLRAACAMTFLLMFAILRLSARYTRHPFYAAAVDHVSAAAATSVPQLLCSNTLKISWTICNGISPARWPRTIRHWTIRYVAVPFCASAALALFCAYTEEVWLLPRTVPDVTNVCPPHLLSRAFARPDSITLDDDSGAAALSLTYQALENVPNPPRLESMLCNVALVIDAFAPSHSLMVHRSPRSRQVREALGCAGAPHNTVTARAQAQTPTSAENVAFSNLLTANLASLCQIEAAVAESLRLWHDIVNPNLLAIHDAADLLFQAYNKGTAPISALDNAFSVPCAVARPTTSSTRNGFHLLRCWLVDPARTIDVPFFPRWFTTTLPLLWVPIYNTLSKASARHLRTHIIPDLHAKLETLTVPDFPALLIQALYPAYGRAPTSDSTPPSDGSPLTTLISGLDHFPELPSLDRAVVDTNLLAYRAQEAAAYQRHLGITDQQATLYNAFVKAFTPSSPNSTSSRPEQDRATISSLQFNITCARALLQHPTRGIRATLGWQSEAAKKIVSEAKNRVLYRLWDWGPSSKGARRKMNGMDMVGVGWSRWRSWWKKMWSWREVLL